MSVNLFDVDIDDVKLFGQPVHGVVRAGYVSLAAGQSKVWPQPDGGGVWLIRVPGATPVVRSEAEADWDAKNGYEWRDYALISGGAYGGTQRIHTGWGTRDAESIFIADDSSRWLLTWRAQDQPGSFQLIFKRYLHIVDGQYDYSVSRLVINLPLEFWSTIAESNDLIVVCQAASGRSVVLAAWDLNKSLVVSMIRVDLGGAIDLETLQANVSVTWTLIEYPKRVAGKYTHDDTFSGEWREVFWELFEWRETDGTSSGEVFKYEEILVNGVIDRSNSTLTPPDHAGNGAWVLIDHGRTLEPPSRRAISVQKWQWSRVAWAAFDGDKLKLLNLIYEHKEINDWSGIWLDETTYGVERKSYLGKSSTTYSLISSYGDQVISKFEDQWELPSGVGFLGLMMETSGRKADTPIETDSTQVPLWLNREVIYAGPFDKSKFSNSLVMVKKQQGTGPVIPLSIHSPGGQHVTLPSGVSVDKVRATWQPVTGEIVVSITDDVCWI